MKPSLRLHNNFLRSSLALALSGVLLFGCMQIDRLVSGNATQAPSALPTQDCPVTEPVWDKPPADAAVQDEPAYGYYFINQDKSIWASAAWAAQDSSPLRVSQDGIKVGWFRPAGAELTVTGQRLDGPAPALIADLPCCYPTRFQASGLYFSTQGCWQVHAQAAGRELSFTVRVEP